MAGCAHIQLWQEIGSGVGLKEYSVAGVRPKSPGVGAYCASSSHGSISRD